MMKTHTFSYTILSLAAAFVLAMAGSVQAAHVFTQSDQLNLEGQNVLAAVNFYFPNTTKDWGDQAVTSPIQGVTFQNVDIGATPSPSPLALSGGGTLDYSTLPQLGNNNGAREQTGLTTLGGPDGTEATDLAKAIVYFQTGQSASLDFDFGLANANRLVEVQLPGGDQGWTGNLSVSVGGNAKGTIIGDGDNATAQLLTFTATTDANGLLSVALSMPAGSAGISGVMVTVADPPRATRTISLPLANPGFEADTVPGGVGAVEGATGWTTVTGGTLTHFWTTDGSDNTPAVAQGGTNYLTANRTATIPDTASNPTFSSASQSIDLSAYATDIDQGGATLDIDFFYHDADGNDQGEVTVEFFDGSSGLLGTSTSGAMADTGASWGEGEINSGAIAVPVNTRSVTLNATATRLNLSATNVSYDNFAAAITVVTSAGTVLIVR